MVNMDTGMLFRMRKWVNGMVGTNMTLNIEMKSRRENKDTKWIEMVSQEEER